MKDKTAAIKAKLPKFTLDDLINSGVHYGHKENRWNPKMKPYIYETRKGTHILDLRKSYALLQKALLTIYIAAKNNKRILFVGTKPQASPFIAEHAKRCGQYYINHRWLGGTITNWQTVSDSIKTLKEYESILADKESDLVKKELIRCKKKHDKLESFLGGIREMGGKPDLLFIIDVNKERLAVAEAKKLEIPIVAIIDSNSNPDGILYPILGNDDSMKANELYCRLAADSVLQGIKDEMLDSGVDVDKMGYDSSSLDTKRPNKHDNKNKKGRDSVVKQENHKNDAKESTSND